MTDVDSIDLGQLRVFTNGGRVAYPLAASGLDPQAAPAAEPTDQPDSPIDSAERYQYQETVDESLLRQLGAVLLRIDSGVGSVMCYFRAHTEQPVQLTGQYFAEDVSAALQSLPDLIDRYVTEVRGGTLVDRSLETVDPTNDAAAFAALDDATPPKTPWSDALWRHILKAGPVDIAVPSIREGVEIARYLGTHDDLPDLTIVVTKGERIEQLDDVDLVLSVGDVDAPMLEDHNRFRKARMQLLASKLPDRLLLLQSAIDYYGTTRLFKQSIADTVEDSIEGMDVVVKPRLQYRLQLLAGVVAGLLVGSVGAARWTTPNFFPSWSAIGSTIEQAVTTAWLVFWNSPALQALGGLVGLTGLAMATLRLVAPDRLPERPRLPVGAPRQTWPTYRQLLWGMFVVVCLGSLVGFWGLLTGLL